MVSLVLMGLFCVFTEMEVILEKGLWYGFNGPAFFSIFVSALGGLTVAAGKYANRIKLIGFDGQIGLCFIVHVLGFMSLP